ncbi:MAG: hypothetical protein ACXVXP_08830 [Mycobacteriaceae bacterium]
MALAQAGLTNQDVREVVVLTQTNRRDLTIQGRRVRVAKVESNELWGGEACESGLVVARPVRAFCDCAGTKLARIPATRMAEALEAFLGSSPHAVQRLSRAVKRFSSPVVARRLGYLVELISGEDAATPFRALLGSSHKADALDPGDQESPIVARWRIRTQRTPEELLEHRRIS